MRFTRLCNGLAYWPVRHPLRPNLNRATSKRHLKRMLKMNFLVHCKVVKIQQTEEEKIFIYTNRYVRFLIFPCLYSLFAVYIFGEVRQFDYFMDTETQNIIAKTLAQRKEGIALSRKFQKYDNA